MNSGTRFSSWSEGNWVRYLELNSTKPGAKKRGTKAKTTHQNDMHEFNTPQLDLFD